MNQPDQSNLQNSADAFEKGVFAEGASEAGADKINAARTEWLPEDDDDWYEPDCCRNDRRAS